MPLKKTTSFSFEVTEAIFAVDVTTGVSQLSKQASQAGSISIDYIQFEVDQDSEEWIAEVISIEEEEEEQEPKVLLTVEEAKEFVTYDEQGN